MEFRLSREQEIFKRTLREFADKNIAPRAREIDEKEQGIPREIIQGLADLGVLGATIPEAYGGSASPGEEVQYAAIAAHEVARGDLGMSLPVYVLLNLGWSLLVARHGTEELKRELLPKVANATSFLGIGTTEAGGGSDLAAIKTTAKRNATGYVLNGEKVFVSGILEARERNGGHLTLAKTAPELGGRGMTLLYVPANSPGIEYTIFRHMGRMGLSTGGLTFKNVEVPAKYLLGEENRGFQTVREGFNAARTLVASACVGAGERCLEIGTEYTKQRILFGQPLAKFEGISFEIADDYSHLEMLKNYLMRTAWMIDKHLAEGAFIRGELNSAVAICKLRAPALAVDIVKHAMMWHGAMGYTKETPLELCLRGLMSYLVGAEGGANIMKIIIGAEYIGDVAVPYR